MNIPTMTNAQFALWYAPAYPGNGTILERAEFLLQWLENSEKKVIKPITPKGK
jgi:hypothetical protein